MGIKDCTLEGTVVARGEFVGVLTSEGVRSNLFDGVTEIRGRCLQGVLLNRRILCKFILAAETRPPRHTVPMLLLTLSQEPPM